MDALKVKFTMKREEDFNVFAMKGSLSDNLKRVGLELKHFHYEEAKEKTEVPFGASSYYDTVSFAVIGGGMPTYEAVLDELNRTQKQLGTFHIFAAEPQFAEI